MAGATSPRLQLELLVARLLLPAADDDARGLAARLERLERGGLGAAPTGAAAAAPGAAPAAAQPVASQPVAPEEEPVRRRPPVAMAEPEQPVAAPASPAAPVSPAASAERPVAGSPPSEAVASPDAEPGAGPTVAAPVRAAPSAAPAPSSAPAPPVSPAAPAGADAPSSGGPAQVETELLRRRWPEVLETMAGMRRATWALVSQNAQVGELTGTTLSFVFSSPGLATAFRNGSHADVVQRALVETLGVDVRVEGTLAGADALK